MSTVSNCPCCLPPITYKTNFTTFWQMIKTANVGAGSTGYPEQIRRVYPQSLLISCSTLKVDNTGNFVYAGIGPQIQKFSATDFTAPILTISSGSFIGTLHNHGMCLDTSNNDIIYCAVSSSLPRLRKSDSSGTPIFDIFSGSGVANVCTDNAYIYLNNFSNNILKYDIAGTLIWTQTHGLSFPSTFPTHRGIACNSSCVAIATDRGNGPDPSSGLSPTGSTTQTVSVRDVNTRLVLWTADHGARCWDCAYLSNGDLVVAGETSSGVNVRCYDTSGTQKWSYNHGVSLYYLTVDSSDNIYAVGDVTIVGGVQTTTIKLDKNGNRLWLQDFGFGALVGTGVGGNPATTTANCVAVDPSANKVYTGGIHYNYWPTQ